LGVISHVAEPEALETTAGSVIDRLASNAPLSLKAMKALIVRQLTYRDGIVHDDIDTLVATVRRSEDAQEGMAARLARRKPHFKGR
jgi:enoyl-CoA hydratase/carnithine racemase